jgi:hypothetical protein
MTTTASWARKIKLFRCSDSCPYPCNRKHYICDSDFRPTERDTDGELATVVGPVHAGRTRVSRQIAIQES